MTPEQESDLFTALGRIENKLDNCVTTLASHTVQDSVNFAKIDADLEDLKLERAHRKGVEEEAAKHATLAGGKAGAAVSLVITGVVTALMTYFGAK